MLQRSPYRRRNRSRSGSDLGNVAGRVVSHQHVRGIARQPLRRFRGNARALNDRLPWRIGVGEHRRVDVDYYLVALAGRAGLHPVMERGFRE